VSVYCLHTRSVYNSYCCVRRDISYLIHFLRAASCLIGPFSDVKIIVETSSTVCMLRPSVSTTVPLGQVHTQCFQKIRQMTESNLPGPDRICWRLACPSHGLAGRRRLSVALLSDFRRPLLHVQLATELSHRSVSIKK
jgi:hypothetical protein